MPMVRLAVSRRNLMDYTFTLEVGGSPADPSQGQAQPGRCPACDLDASGQTVDLWEYFSGK